MKTQISRDSRDPGKRYSSVYQQQGRMLTDADWNELAELVKERLDEALHDVIGSGAPRERGVVEVTPGPGSGETVTLRWGRVYVDGIAGEVRPDPDSPAASGTDLVYDAQADFPQPPAISGDHRLYLDVWERAVTSLEDAALRDPGLHGADTCTRTQTMAQVKRCPIDVDPEDPAVNPPRGTAALSLVIRAGSTAADPCDPCADEVALQSRVGNYLFRVEVHDVTLGADGLPARLVLKWSSENGAEAYPVSSEPPGFKASAWVYEFFSGADAAFASEKHLGVHLATGSWTPTRGALTAGYPGTPPANLSHVRRWDGYCTLDRATDGTWSLATDGGGAALGRDRAVSLSTSSAGDAPGHIDLGASAVIQLDALVLTLALDGAVFVAGDYWYAPVREAVHGAGDVVLDAAPPDGILHHYMTLVEVVGETVTRFTGDDCQRSPFPPLTDLRAQDICYDNTHCDLSDSATVQEALDRLCQERDLRFHNKHLHGWGIVCGLQVQCGPDTSSPGDGEPAPRHQVTVRKGYALDCEGNDIVLDEPVDRDVFELIKQYEDAHPNDGPMLDDGSGSVCLTLGLDADGKPSIGATPYEPESLASLLKGTVWSDFYQDCIKEPLDALKHVVLDERFDSDDPDALDLVPPSQKRLTTLLNLLVYMYSNDGRYVWTSIKEDDELRSCYEALREVLRSKTFCGMYKGDEFPDYPFPDTGRRTVFGKALHTRVRLHPDGRYVYTCGGSDTSIHVFDVDRQTMVAELDMPAGQGAVVKNVALSPDGSTLFAVASLQGVDTIFGVADITGAGTDALDHAWRPVAVICDVELVTLVNAPKDGARLYAIGRGRGLYILDPEALLSEAKPQLQPAFAFNATGPMTVDNDWVYATAGADSASAPPGEVYVQLVSMNPAQAPAGGNGAPADHRELQHNGTKVTGSDDIIHAVITDATGLTRTRVCTVIRQGTQKFIHVYGVHDGTFLELEGTIAVDDTPIRLAFHHRQSKLLATMADSFRVQIIDAVSLQTVMERHPVQLYPVSVAVHSKAPASYVLNGLSRTITVIPDAELVVTDSDFLAKLQDYRFRALAAYLQLIAGLLQFLKDCFCEHLLVDCPTCDDDPLYLACVEIRDARVYRICNFSKRKYVKSFPTVGYWLSVVPVLPFVKLAVEKVCCSILPDLFGKIIDKQDPRKTASSSLASKAGPTAMHGAVMLAKGADLAGEIRAGKKSLDAYRKLGMDALVRRVQVTSPITPGVRKTAYLDTPADSARKDLESRGIIVDAVEPYDPAAGASRLSEFRALPTRLPPGTRVKLYQRDGVVMSYAAVEDTVLRGGGVGPDVTAEIEALERRKANLRDMSDVNAELARVDARRAELMSLGAVRSEVSTLLADKQTAAREVAALKEDLEAVKAARESLANVSAVRSEISALRAELDRLEADRTAASARVAEVESRRAAMLDDVASLRASMAELAEMNKRLTLEVSRGRPARDVSGVTADIDGSLRELGIRTVSELADAEPATLSGAGIDRAAATRVIAAAKKRLAPQ